MCVRNPGAKRNASMERFPTCAWAPGKAVEETAAAVARRVMLSRMHCNEHLTICGGARAPEGEGKRACMSRFLKGPLHSANTWYQAATTQAACLFRITWTLTPARAQALKVGKLPCEESAVHK